MVRAQRVVAGQHLGVLPAPDPATQLRGPQHREGVGLPLQREQLEHAVPQVPDRVVLGGLGQERVDLHLADPGPAGGLHQRPQRGVRVLADQQPGPVGGELRLARPLLQRGHHGAHPERPERHPGHPGRHPDQVEQQGPVDRVAGGDVPDLVADHEAQLVVRHQVHGGCVQHHEGPVQTERDRVHPGVVHQVELGHLVQVERGRGLDHHGVHRRELARADPDRHPEVHQSQRALGDQPGGLAQHGIEALQRAQRG